MPASPKPVPAAIKARFPTCIGSASGLIESNSSGLKLEAQLGLQSGGIDHPGKIGDADDPVLHRTGHAKAGVTDPGIVSEEGLDQIGQGGMVFAMERRDLLGLEPVILVAVHGQVGLGASNIAGEKHMIQLDGNLRRWKPDFAIQFPGPSAVKMI
jgi:hypothetical protein